MIIFLGLVGQLLLNDFDLGKKYFERADYRIARAFFEEFIETNPDGRSVPEAKYCLIRIADAEQDFPEYWDLSNRYLNDYKYGTRREEIFNLLLTRLTEKGGYPTAFDYLAKYDYLEPDTLLRNKITLTLLEQTPGSDRIWESCPQTDTFRILRTGSFPDADSRDELYRKIGGFKGTLLRIENFLQAGDTIRAYFVFRDRIPAEIPAELRYRFTKICRLFDRGLFDESRDRLRSMKGWENKAALLRALEYGRDGEKFVPRDDEETRLWIQVCDYDTIPRNPPDSVNLDSVLIDTARSFEKLESLRSASPPNFHLDSLYGEALLIRDRAVEAGQVVGKYLKFQNVQRYVRTVQGFASYDRGDFGRALKNLILGQNRSLSVLYRIADCLEKTNRDGRDYYRAALALSPDSALRTTYLKKLLPIEFARGNYPALTAIPFADLSADTGLVRIYLMSLARAGLRPRADSLYLAYFGGFDPDYINRFGEYLIDGRSFPRALVLYDSLIAAAATRLSDQIFYNWALVPFQSGAYDTAQERFRYFAVQFKNSPKYGAVLFKIATIKYQLGDFDSAGFYYLKSVTDSSLRHDALQNGMIAYKKAEDWKEVIGLGRKFLDVCAEAEKPEAAFEIGYAHLRLGSFRKSIDYFRKAVAGDPQPEFHYWLAETYLGRGDFIRALYHYQAIVNKFPKDEMWEPTAEFKSGLALEFLDATAEAKKLYEGIIKRRGKEDVWGKEAVKRLELLK